MKNWIRTQKLDQALGPFEKRSMKKPLFARGAHSHHAYVQPSHLPGRPARALCVLLELAPRRGLCALTGTARPPVAGLHRASPSASLDKSCRYSLFSRGSALRSRYSVANRPPQVNGGDKHFPLTPTHRPGVRSEPTSRAAQTRLPHRANARPAPGRVCLSGRRRPYIIADEISGFRSEFPVLLRRS